MKILLINSFCGQGSTGRICTDLYDILVENGHECCIAYGRGKFEDSTYKTYKIGNAISIYNHVIQTRLFDRVGLASKISTLKFLKFVRNYNPDIVHLHNLHGYYLNYKILFNYLKKEFKGKVFWTLHDQWPLTKHGAYLDNLAFEKRRFFLESYPKAYFRLYDNLKLKKDSITALKQLTIITPSNWLKRTIDNSYLNVYSNKVINNGIDMSSFYPDGTVENKKKILLFVANVWEKRKGYEEIRKLQSLINNSEYQIVIIGEIEKDTKPINNAIHIERTENIAELRKWYSSAFCFINPTFADNFPTTNIEALACGTPVITYDTGGSSESIEPKVGFAVYKGDLSKVVQLVHNEISKIKASDCVIRAKKFDKKVKFNEYLELFESAAIKERN
ncbi:glycosyltransferase [Enterococcus avium]|uniref:glycosyltransferase n=1 Tax=Enterococcus avium TaxID=33945 RepID=UPI00346299F6